MSDTTGTAPAATAEQQQIHQEGIAHINAKLDETDVAPASHATTSAALPSEPPASNPGHDDPTGGIPAGAGGVSGAAHKDVPNPNTTATGSTGPNADKRKSIVGTFKGFLGFDKKSQKGNNTSSTASDGTYVGAATAAVAATATAVTETVQQYNPLATTEASATTTTEKKDIGYEPSTAANTEPIAAAGTGAAAPAQPTDKITAGEVAKSADPASSKANVENEANTDGAADKPPKEASGDPANRTNPDAIPTAGGKKVGEDTWGESDIIPEVPPVAGENDVAANTAANTGTATSGPGTTDAATAPAAGTSEPPKEKGKFLQKLKDKLPIGKGKKSEK